MKNIFKIVPSFTMPIVTSVTSGEAFVCGGHFKFMKKIPLGGKLGKNQFALVDDEDYDFIMKWKWQAVRGNNDNTIYARTTMYIPEKTGMRMHRLINKTPKGKLTDHIDGNGLNNQKSNLRTCTPAQNQHNSSPQKKSSSRYKGVSRHKSHKLWSATICVNKKLIHLGYFTQEIEAASAYNDAAIKYFGEFAKINEIGIDFEKTGRVVRKKSSIYRGVYYSANRWRGILTVDGKSYSLGGYFTQEEAAIAYNRKAIELLGNSAQLNIIKTEATGSIKRGVQKTVKYRGVHFARNKYMVSISYKKIGIGWEFLKLLKMLPLHIIKKRLSYLEIRQN